MATRNCANCSYAEVNNAVNGIAGGNNTWTGSPAPDGTIVNLPAGTATWTATLNITANITLAGAGESSTIITENLPTRGVNAAGVISVSLSKELPAPNYSFRLTGFKLKSAVGPAEISGDGAIVKLFGNTNGDTIPTPYVRGCVSRVRVDHITFDNLNGISLGINGCLGVGDHLTFLYDGSAAYDANACSVWHDNWTPDLDPFTGDPLPSSYVALDSFGSWADDNYFGTDKFWFMEDCYIECNTNITDDEQGGRSVWRHCTSTRPGAASHGMEGRRQPGVRAREIYNNYWITSVSAPQTRSGSLLYFNNRSTGASFGITFRAYRNTRYEPNWGRTSGDNRYDDNDTSVGTGGILYTGTVTAIDSGGKLGITGSNANFNLINMSDGSEYVIKNFNKPITLNWDPFTTGLANDSGWEFNCATITSVSGQHLGFGIENTYATIWAPGDTYEIRKIRAVWGGIGWGKGRLLNKSNPVIPGGSYSTFFYPATSGTKATWPQAGFSREPCYSWNNTDDSHGYLNFITSSIKSALPNRDYFNLSQRSIETQQVGWPAQNYTKATSDWPLIGKDSDISYTPFTYPHPLQTVGGGASGPIISLGGDMTFGDVVIGEAPTSTLSVANNGDASLSVTNITLPTGFTITGTTSFTVAAGAHVDRTITFTPLLEQLYSGTIVVTSNASSGSGSIACSGTGVPPVGGGGGGGKGRKKGVLIQRSRS